MMTYLKCLAVWCGLLLSGCFSGRNGTVAPDDRKQIFRGYLVPHQADAPSNRIVKVGFLQSAQVFTLDMRLPAAKRYYQLLKAGIDACVPLKVSVFDSTTAIASIAPAPDEVIEAYRKALKKP
jgi:hypothetical protein